MIFFFWGGGGGGKHYRQFPSYRSYSPLETSALGTQASSNGIYISFSCSTLHLAKTEGDKGESVSIERSAKLDAYLSKIFCDVYPY